MSEVLPIEKVSRGVWSARSGRRAGRISDVLDGDGWLNVDADVFCLHCGDSFKVKDVAVDTYDGLLVCPTEGCDGSVFDFSLEPWTF